MKHIISQFSLVVSLLCFSLCGKAQSSHEREESIPYGDFDKWMVRVIDESLIIGGRSKCLYEVAPADTVRGDIPYKSSSESPWRTSNVMARVSGVTKCSVSVFPEPRDSGYCVRLETLLDSCKVFGLFNIKVLVPGTIYMGQMMEPIRDTKNPQSKLNAGVPFTKRPKAVVLDYKFTTPGTDHRIKSTGFSRQRRMKDDLIEHIPELVAKIAGIFPIDGIADLVSFFDHVPAHALVALHPVPGTTVRSAQAFDHVSQRYKVRLVMHENPSLTKKRSRRSA